MAELAPLDETITLEQLDRDPFPVYARLRREAPVCRVKAAGRTFLTKAADTKYVKDNPELFSSDDPNTPMKRAFRAHTLMRKDGEEHLRERMAMAPAFAPRVIRGRMGAAPIRRSPRNMSGVCRAARLWICSRPSLAPMRRGGWRCFWGWKRPPTSKCSAGART